MACCPLRIALCALCDDVVDIADALSSPLHFWPVPFAGSSCVLRSTGRGTVRVVSHILSSSLHFWPVPLASRSRVLRSTGRGTVRVVVHVLNITLHFCPVPRASRSRGRRDTGRSTRRVIALRVHVTLSATVDHDDVHAGSARDDRSRCRGRAIRVTCRISTACACFVCAQALVGVAETRLAVEHHVVVLRRHQLQLDPSSLTLARKPCTDERVQPGESQFGLRTQRGRCDRYQLVPDRT